jgi:hypothetical protein
MIKMRERERERETRKKRLDQLISIRKHETAHFPFIVAKGNTL